MSHEITTPPNDVTRVGYPPALKPFSTYFPPDGTALEIDERQPVILPPGPPGRPWQNVACLARNPDRPIFAKMTGSYRLQPSKFE